MRDPQRLYAQYGDIRDYHRLFHPDLRIGQLMDNYRQWLNDKYQIDMFYIEDHLFVRYLEEYITSLKTIN
jgi:hypothetical protein